MRSGGRTTPLSKARNRTPVNPKTQADRIKTPLSKASRPSVKKRSSSSKARDVSSESESDSGSDSDSGSGSGSSSSDSSSSDDSSSSGGSASESSASETPHPLDPKREFIRQVKEIKKMNISVEEKKNLIREKIRERKKKEIQLKINLLQKKKLASESK